MATLDEKIDAIGREVDRLRMAIAINEHLLHCAQDEVAVLDDTIYEAIDRIGALEDNDEQHTEQGWRVINILNEMGYDATEKR